MLSAPRSEIEVRIDTLRRKLSDLQVRRERVQRRALPWRRRLALQFTLKDFLWGTATLAVIVLLFVLLLRL